MTTSPSIRVASLRRYPVKSMGGEALTEVEVDERGLVGDRGFAVVDEDGLFASGKDSRRFSTSRRGLRLLGANRARRHPRLR